MLKVQLGLQFRSLLIPYISQSCLSDPFKPPLFFIKSFFTESQNRAYTSTPHLNSTNLVFAEYLVNSLKLSKTEATAISRRYPCVSSFEKPEAVIRFFKALGFSDTEIQFSIKRQPTILFADVENNIKPKVAFFQELGLCGPRLGMMISRNPSLLRSSLDKKLIPSIEVIKEVLKTDGSEKSTNNFNVLMFRILSRSAFVIGNDSRLRSNITYLRNCGVCSSQLISLLKFDLRLLSTREEELRNLVSRAIEMGFMMGSRMLVYAILALYSNTAETINTKFKLLHSFGFSQDECNEMFLKSPNVFRVSEAKLRSNVELFLQRLMVDKSVLVGSPVVLCFSPEKRMIPRYKILEMIKSRSLLKNEPNFISVAFLPEMKFVEKYILRFGGIDAKELQLAYENYLLES